jgi:DNA-binding LacI/PurR family transcriptional regulator
MANANPRRRATISDVAKLAGVSIATVSRVVNETAPVAGETVREVQMAMAKLDYTPNAAARSLAGRKTKTIGLLLPEIAGEFFLPLIRGIESIVQDQGFDLLIHASSQPYRERGGMISPLGEHNVDGLLVFTDRLSDSAITRLHGRGFPLVLLHRSPPAGLDIPCVTFENKAGARRLVEHLIVEHGSRRIAFLAGPQGNEDSYWREAGYREALGEHDIALDPDLIGIGEFNDIKAQAVVAGWLRQGLEFDAIFAGDDEAATGAMLALRRAGKRIPDDVAVVGFDDVVLARLMSPPLTTIHAPIETSGRVAAQQLFSLLQTGAGKSLTLLPTNLVIRQSCGCSNWETSRPGDQ